MDRSVLEAATARGIIDSDQLQALLAFAAEQDGEDDDAAPSGEEQLRFVRSFGDIFITLGVIFLSVAMAQLDLEGWQQIGPIVFLIATTEWLVGMRRLALPGIVLLIALLYFTGAIVGVADATSSLISFAATAIVSAVYYWRYRTPFSVTPLVLGLTGVLASVFGLTPMDIIEMPALLAGFGVLVFLAAMAFDARDRERANRYSDTGFWLHLMAAPMLVHGVMAMLLAVEVEAPLAQGLMLVFFLVFVLTALFVDRRAMLVSSLAYAIYAVTRLLSEDGNAVGDTILLVFIGFGVFVIAFGAYWYAARRVLFGWLAERALARFVPPFQPR
ncbi:MAG: hypothetical protein KDI42_05435 [Gammaproteobacteria bacterium]|nr:hypothetical protein [Gammaproteobacteria bacterium]